MTQANPVEFTATPSLAGNKVKWQLCHTNPATPPIPKCGTSNGTYPDVVLDANASPYTFKFKIVGDTTGMGIRFAANDPLVVKSGEPTGQKQIGTPNGQGSDTLTFVDLNTLPNGNQPNPVVISYGLNFTDSNGNQVTSIDPDITNGGNPGVVEPPPGAGGGRSESDYASYLPAFGLGLLAGIILVLLFQRFRPMDR